jgi:hypothetical protein
MPPQPPTPSIAGESDGSDTQEAGRPRMERPSTPSICPTARTFSELTLHHKPQLHPWKSSGSLPHVSFLMHHASCITHHASRITHHASSAHMRLAPVTNLAVRTPHTLMPVASGSKDSSAPHQPHIGADSQFASLTLKGGKGDQHLSRQTSGGSNVAMPGREPQHQLV